jgi:metallophosphoesterase superfamily enzyme
VIHGDQSHDAIGTGEGEWIGPKPGRQWIPRGLICGHQHPAVILRNRIQNAKMPCFARCDLALPGNTSKSVPLILLPAFSRAPLGSDLSERHWIVDVPWPGEERMRIFGIVERKAEAESGVLDFGPLAELRLPF